MSHTETTIVVPPPQTAPDRIVKRVQIETPLPILEQARDLRPAIAALLLGVRYRGYLMAGEQELLDQLAPEKGIAFLLSGRKYLHPAGVELFPAEDMASAMSAGSGCVFSQTRRSTSDEQQTNALMTVALGPDSNNRLIFGALVPLGMRRDPTALARFHALARQFEEAWKEVACLTARMEEQIQPHTSWLLVNRASGRTLAVSPSASLILKRNSRDLIDVEFGRVREVLAPMIARTTLTMNSVESAILPLCIVRLEPRSSHADQTDLAAFMVHKMRNKISSIYTASTYLQSTACWKCESDEADLARIIESEVSELDQQLHRFYLLLGYEHMQRIPVCLAEAINGRMAAIRSTRLTVQDVRISGNSDSAIINAPTGAVEHLLESVIQSHTQDYVEPSAIDIGLKIDQQTAEITVRTSLAGTHSQLSPAAGWVAVANRLAALLDCSIDHNTDMENGIISTILRIPLSHE